jgi:hypothetical protein
MNLGRVIPRFRELEHYGFIVATERGCLGVYGKGRAPRWRLTELAYMHEPPTRDFTRWKNGNHFQDRRAFQKAGTVSRGTQKQKPVPENKNTVFQKAGTLAFQKAGTLATKSVPESWSKEDVPSVPENGNKYILPSGVGRAGSSAEPVSHAPEAPSEAAPDAHPAPDERPASSPASERAPTARRSEQAGHDLTVDADDEITPADQLYLKRPWQLN